MEEVLIYYKIAEFLNSHIGTQNLLTRVRERDISILKDGIYYVYFQWEGGNYYVELDEYGGPIADTFRLANI